MKQSSIIGSLLGEIGNVESLEQALCLYKRLGMGAKTSQRTRVEYENDIADLIAFLSSNGVTHLSQVGLAHLRIYQAEMERRGYKPSTCNRKTFAVKGYFSFLYDYAFIKDNLSKKLIPPTVERGEPRFLSEAEYTRLGQVCAGNPRNAAIIELFLQTGIRLSELVGLTINDVTLPLAVTSDSGFTGSIRIKRGNRHVTIPLNYKAAKALKTWLEIREPILDTALFITTVKKPMGKRAVQLMLEKYLDEVGIENASVQSLRHTMTVHHLANGTPLKTLAEILGDDPNTLKVYLSLARKVHQHALQVNSL